MTLVGIPLTDFIRNGGSMHEKFIKSLMMLTKYETAHCTNRQDELWNNPFATFRKLERH